MHEITPAGRSLEVQDSTHARDVPIFLMSPPREDWELRGRANFRSRRAGAADARLARQEWAALADAIVDAGGEVLVCPPPPDAALTGMIYTAEAGEFYRREDGSPGFLLPNMAAAHRRGEAQWVAAQLSRWGIEARQVGAHGSPLWEAQGDAIRADSPARIIHTFGQGPDARTQADAGSLVADLLGPEHLHLRFLADPWFHGNTFLNVYRAPKTPAARLLQGARHHVAPAAVAAAQGGSALAVVCPQALDASEYARLQAFLPGVSFHEISRDESLGYDTNALQVDDLVLAPMTLSAGTEAALIALGLSVRRLELGELFLKGGGAPVCLTNRLWGLRLDEVPPDVRWSLRPSIDSHRAR